MWWEGEERSRYMEKQMWYSKVEVSRCAEEAKKLLKENRENPGYPK